MAGAWSPPEPSISTQVLRHTRLSLEEHKPAMWNMLKRAWAAWKAFGKKVGNFQARVLLTIFYAVLMLPFGLAARWFSDPLRIKKLPDAWLDHPDEAYDMEWAHKQ